MSVLKLLNKFSNKYAESNEDTMHTIIPSDEKNIHNLRSKREQLKVKLIKDIYEPLEYYGLDRDGTNDVAIDARVQNAIKALGI